MLKPVFGGYFAATPMAESPFLIEATTNFKQIPDPILPQHLQLLTQPTTTVLHVIIAQVPCTQVQKISLTFIGEFYSNSKRKKKVQLKPPTRHFNVCPFGKSVQQMATTFLTW